MSAAIASFYRPDIQGLRAIAVLLVLFGHFDVPGFSGGFIGVDVFFVLSGYLITRLLMREQSATGRVQYLRFISRRLKRLLPTLLFVLVVVSVTALLTLTEYEARIQSGSFAFAATWTSNLYFALAELDYFSPLQARDLYLHTWSLGVEEQFYLVWPLLIIAAHGVLRRNGVANVRRRMSLILSGVAILSLGLTLSLFWSETDAMIAFYSMPTRAWQFALGAFVSLILLDYEDNDSAPRDSRLSRLHTTTLAWIGIALVLASAMLLHRQVTYPGYLALFPSFGAALVIALANKPNAVGVHQLLSHRYSVWLGDRSYSIYLWHWPLLVLTARIEFANSALQAIFLTVVSVALASLSYRWIELPFWKGKLSSASPGRSILVSILAILIVIFAMQGLRSAFYGDDVARGFAIDYDPRSDFTEIYSQGCDTWYRNADVIPCSNTDVETSATAVLIGDSIGTQWHSALSEIYSAPDWRLVTFTKSACSMVDEDYFYERIKRVYTECSEWRDAVIERVVSMRPELVIIGNSATYRFTQQQWVEGSRRVLDKLTQATDQVIVIPGSPALSDDGPTCLERARDPDECAESISNPAYADVSRYLTTATQDFDNALVVDLSDIICPDNRCAALSADGVVVFRDDQHVTSRFALSRAAEIRERLAVTRSD